MQGIGIEPPDAAGRVVNALHLISGHGFPVDLERHFIVIAVAAHGHIDMLVEDKAVGIRSDSAASRLLDAVHLVGIAPAAVGCGEIVGHGLIVLITAVGLGQFRNQDFIRRQIFSPAVDMSDVVVLRVDGDVIVVDAEVGKHLRAHVLLVIVVLCNDQVVADGVSASVLHHVASSVYQVHAIEGYTHEGRKSRGYRVVVLSRTVIHVVHNSGLLAGKDIPGAVVAHPVGI